MRWVIAVMFVGLAVASAGADDAWRGLWRVSYGANLNWVGDGKPTGYHYSPSEESLRIQWRAGGLRVRRREELLLASATVAMQSGINLLVGDMALDWATGGLLGEATGDPLEKRNRINLSAGFPLRMRPTTAVRGAGQRGLVIAALRHRLQLASWILRRQAGFALGGGPCGLALHWPELTRPGAFAWSVVVRTSFDDRAQERFLCEWFGSRRAGSIGGRGWGGAFSLGPRAPLGSLRGVFRYVESAAEEDPTRPAGWRVAWNLPLMAGLEPEVELRTLRRAARAQPLPTIERQAALAVCAEPWSGAFLRLTLASVRLQQCRGVPDDPEEKMIASTARFISGFIARIRLSARAEWLLRYRQSGGAIEVDAAARSPELPLQLRPEDFEEAVAEDQPLARSWERSSGGLLWSALRWKTGDRWSGSFALAATPAGAGRASSVPVRIPPGRSQWRSLGAQRWLAEGWLARRGGAHCTEFVMRWIAGPAPEEALLQVILGWSWRFGRR